MAKIESLADIGANYASITKINANMAKIEAAIENTVSRDGSTPNFMTAPLDMNSQKIINVAAPVLSHHVATKAYVDALSLGETGALIQAQLTTGNGIAISDSAVISIDQSDSFSWGGRHTFAHTPVYDQAANVLSSDMYWGRSITIPTTKQMDIQNVTETWTLGASSTASGVRHNITVDGPDATANGYGLISALTAKNGATVKTVYARAVADTAHTGILVAGNFVVDPGASTGTSWVQQIGLITNRKKVDRIFSVGSGRTVETLETADYGLLFDGNIAFNQAAIQAAQKGSGDFLRYLNNTESAYLARITLAGLGEFTGLTVNAASTFNSVINLATQVVLSLSNGTPET